MNKNIAGSYIKLYFRPPYLLRGPLPASLEAEAPVEILSYVCLN